MQSNNNLYKNLPGNINNRVSNYPNSRMNNEFQSKKGICILLFKLNKILK